MPPDGGPCLIAVDGRFWRDKVCNLLAVSRNDDLLTARDQSSSSLSLFFAQRRQAPHWCFAQSLALPGSAELIPCAAKLIPFSIT
jgi:hypothetical protein